LVGLLIWQDVDVTWFPVTNRKDNTHLPIFGRTAVVRIEQLAEAAINHEALLLRSLTQDFLGERPNLRDYPRPVTVNFETLAAAASLIELLAERSNQEPPSWTKEVGALPQPLHLVKSAATMKHLRALCEQQSPEPLRKRGFYAPPNFLESA